MTGAGMSLAELEEMAVEDATESIEAGNEAIASRKWGLAVEKFTGAIEMLEETGIEAPKLRTEALMGRGNAQLKQQEHNQALADFTAASKAGQAAEQTAAAHRGAATASEGLRRPADALKHLQAATAASPGSVTSDELARVEALISAGGNTGGDAGGAAAAPVSQQPPTANLPDAARKLKEAGNSVYKMGQYGEAAEKYGEAIDLVSGQNGTGQWSPGLAVLYTNRAQARLKDGQLRQCVEDCGRALELDPGSYKALQRRAAANEQREKYKDAASDFAEVVRLKPDDALARTGYLRVTRAAKALDPTYKSVSLSLLVPMASPTSPLLASPPPPSVPELSSTDDATNGGGAGASVSATSDASASATVAPAPESAVTKPNTSSDPKSTNVGSSTAPTSADNAPATSQRKESEGGASVNAGSGPGVPPGTTVVLKGLSKPELNGQQGVAGEFNHSTGRQVVTLNSGKESRQLALKPINFEAVVSVAAESAAQTDGWTQASTRAPTTNASKSAPNTAVSASTASAGMVTTGAGKPPTAASVVATASSTKSEPAQTTPASATPTSSAATVQAPPPQAPPRTKGVSANGGGAAGTEGEPAGKRAPVDAVLKAVDGASDPKTALAGYHKDTLIEVILELRQTTADVNKYMTELVEKVMARCPEALQAP